MNRLLHRPGIFLVLALGFAAAATTLQAQTVQTAREDGYTIITGSMSAPGWSDQAQTVLYDFDAYSAWALRYMDGNDPASADDWALFKEFEFVPPATMILHYDMNYKWPLNSKNNRAEFAVTAERETEIIVFDINRPPFGLNDAHLRLDSSEPGIIVFQIEIKFWWIVEAVLDHDEFELFLADRVVKMQRNLHDRVDGRL